jgi:hypothetical protein
VGIRQAAAELNREINLKRAELDGVEVPIVED